MTQVELSEDSVLQICAVCGKKIAQAAKGSLTDWIFRPTRCQCAVPVVDSGANYRNEEFVLSQAPAADEVELNNRYSVLELIGQGGMGAVYKVQELESGKLRAAKILHKHFLGDTQALSRFENEAKAAQGLEHKNIIKVRDSGISDSGVPFLIMDLSDGETLQTMITRKARLDPEEANPIFVQICDALSYVHSKNILHRDLKPSNVIVENIDKEPIVKLVDFGIAKVISDGTLTSGTTLTRTSELIGSPPYMSPEQCMGHQLSVCSDIYSFGCLIYFALTGKQPFEGENPVQVIVKHLQGQTPDITTQRLDISKDYSRIIANCLYKDPENRYQTVEELKTDLLRAADGKPLARKPFTRSMRLSMSDPRTKVLVGLLIFAAATSAAALSIFYLNPEKEELPATEIQWKRLDLEGQRYFDQGELVKARKTFHAALEIARQLRDPRFIRNTIAELIDLDLAMGLDADAEVKKKESLSIAKGDRFSLSLIEEIDKVLKELKGANKGSYVDQGYLQDLISRALDHSLRMASSYNYEMTAPLVERNRQLIEKVYGVDNEAMASCLIVESSVAFHKNKDRQAINQAVECLELLEKIKSKNANMVGRVYAVLATYLSASASHIKDAVDALKQSLDIYEQSFGSRSVQYASSEIQLAVLHARLGKFELAKNELQHAVEIYETNGYQLPYSTANANRILAYITGNQTLCRQSLAVLESQPFHDYPAIAANLIQLAAMLVESAPEEARSLLNRAAAIQKRSIDSHLKSAAEVDLYETEAELYRCQNKLLEAENAYKKSLAVREPLFGGTYPVLSTLDSLSSLLIEENKTSEAEQYLEKAVKLFESNHDKFDDRKKMLESLFGRYIKLLNSQSKNAKAREIQAKFQKLSTEAG